MKYSEFLKLVAKCIEEGTFIYYHICPILAGMRNSYTDIPAEHFAKLQKTIQDKLQAYNKNKPTSTLNRPLEEQFGSYSYTHLRILWLESLAKYHAARGN